jgi:hypothetical protein
MVVSKCDLPEFHEAKFITMRIAFLKKEVTSEWANLRDASMGELSEVVGGNALKYFKNSGVNTVDYKVELFNQSGFSGNQLVAIYPNENTDVTSHTFIITRVFPILNRVFQHAEGYN